MRWWHGMWWCGRRRRGVRGRCRRRCGALRRRRRGRSGSGGRSRGRRRRRGGPGWCCGRRRGTWRRRCRVRRWRSCLRRSALRGRLGFAIGTEFAGRRGLRHHQRCGLRVRWRAYELHRRQSCRGKQHEPKFCHDGFGPRKIFGRKVLRYTNKPRAALWRPANADSFIFCRTESRDSPLFMAHSGDGFKPLATLSPAAYPTCRDSNPARSPANHQFQRRSRDTACAVLAVPAPAIRPAVYQAIPPAAVLRRGRASAVAPLAADFRAGFLAAAPTVVRA
jgi:hypothetical protein